MDNFNELLDEIETKIEEHRKLALKLIEDRKNFAETLSTIKKSSEEAESLSEVDKEEIQAILERLYRRLASVNVDVKTHRNESQIEALEKVNGKIDDLVDMVQNNSPDAPMIAQSYLNSCSKGTGSKFEALLLSCTSDDQKAVKERIVNIVENVKAIAEDMQEQQQPASESEENQDGTQS